MQPNQCLKGAFIISARIVLFCFSLLLNRLHCVWKDWLTALETGSLLKASGRQQRQQLLRCTPDSYLWEDHVWRREGTLISPRLWKVLMRTAVSTASHSQGLSRSEAIAMFHMCSEIAIWVFVPIL